MYTEIENRATASELEHTPQGIPCACCGAELYGWTMQSWNPAKAPYKELLCKNRACALYAWSINAELYAVDVIARMRELGLGE